MKSEKRNLFLQMLEKYKKRKQIKIYVENFMLFEFIFVNLERQKRVTRHRCCHLYFAAFRKCSKIDFSSSGSEFSLIALARAARHDSMLYFGLNIFSSDLRRPSWMRKKFLILLS